MKLTKTQENIMSEIKHTLDTIKKYDSFNDYMENHIKPLYFEGWEFKDWEMQYHKNNYEKAKENMVYQKANTKTLEKLESFGLIKVVEYRGSQYDLIKVL